MCASVDPAIEVLEELISCDYEAARTRVIVSGASSSCSQKIHNLQRGILKASQDSKYVLCLDDDVQLHPGFLQMAVSHMEADSAAFMLTGQSPSAAHIHPPPRLPTPFSFQHRGGGGVEGESRQGTHPTENTPRFNLALNNTQISLLVVLLCIIQLQQSIRDKALAAQLEVLLLYLVRC